jgi:6-phosphofructo-2-kinase/fructose-2,6-biphosphatase 2
MFIESLCTDVELIMSNIREVKLNSPDYVNMDPDTAADDFVNRIKHYEEAYETIDGEESGRIDTDPLSEHNSSYIKLINVGSQFIINKIKGYLQSRIVYYLMNLHISPRSILMCRVSAREYGLAWVNLLTRLFCSMSAR